LALLILPCLLNVLLILLFFFVFPAFFSRIVAGCMGEPLKMIVTGVHRLDVLPVTKPQLLVEDVK